MRIGNEEHEKALKKKLLELCKKGYTVINLRGKSPPMIVAKESYCKAIVFITKTKRKHKKGWSTNTTRDKIMYTYGMFDSVERWYIKSGLQTRREVIDEAKRFYESDGWNVIETKLKSPDGLAVKDGCVFAVEVLRGDGKLEKRIEWKKDDYDMFDGVLIDTINLGGGTSSGMELTNKENH